MVIVDTSVWINHLNSNDKILINLLEKGKVVTHEFILGELASGTIRNRGTILSLLMDLPRVGTVSLEEFLIFIDNFNINGIGLSIIDINILASAKMFGSRIFTYDKKLLKTAQTLNMDNKWK